MNPYEAPQSPFGAAAPGKIDPERADAIKRKLGRYNTMSFLLGIPGLMLQTVGQQTVGLVGSLETLAGVGLLVGGLVFYAKLRGRHPAFCLLGLLSCLGLLILYFLPKFCINCRAKHSYGVKGCSNCGAPLGA